MTDGNDPAFSRASVFGEDEDRPGNVATYDDGATGLTKREYFAAMAMQGIISDAETVRNVASGPVPIQQVAVMYADALIDALNAEAK